MRVPCRRTRPASSRPVSKAEGEHHARRRRPLSALIAGSPLLLIPLARVAAETDGAGLEPLTGAQALASCCSRSRTSPVLQPHRLASLLQGAEAGGRSTETGRGKPVDMHAGSNRFSTHPSASTSSSPSFRNSLSSSSNGRLTPASERLSIRVPENARYLRGGTSLAGHTREEDEVGGDDGETWVDAEEGGAIEGQHESQTEAGEAHWAAERTRDTGGVGLGLCLDVGTGFLPPLATRTPRLDGGDAGGASGGLTADACDGVPGVSPRSARAESTSHASEASTSSTALSAHPSIASSAVSSDSSTLSVPGVPPVDLSLPNRPNASGPFVSVASGPMGRLAAENAASSRPTVCRCLLLLP